MPGCDKFVTASGDAYGPSSGSSESNFAWSLIKKSNGLIIACTLFLNYDCYSTDKEDLSVYAPSPFPIML